MIAECPIFSLVSLAGSTRKRLPKDRHLRRDSWGKERGSSYSWGKDGSGKNIWSSAKVKRQQKTLMYPKENCSIQEFLSRNKISETTNCEFGWVRSPADTVTAILSLFVNQMHDQKTDAAKMGEICDHLISHFQRINRNVIIWIGDVSWIGAEKNRHLQFRLESAGPLPEWKSNLKQKDIGKK